MGRGTGGEVPPQAEHQEVRRKPREGRGAPVSWLPWARTPDPPDPLTLVVRRVLLASEGRAIPPAAVEFAAGLAGRSSAPVSVVSIARVWGTSLGFPNPALLPSRHEWEEQHRRVAGAVETLKQRGLAVQGHVVGTRNAARRIVREAERLQCDVIVMGADPPRHWLIADLVWSQEPYRVRRRTRLPVYLVTGEPGS